MNDPQKSPIPLEYSTPKPRRSLGEALGHKSPVYLWGVVLCLYPLLTFYGLKTLERTSGSTDPEIRALFWAYLAIAFRSVVAIVRWERNWSSLVYIGLYVLLPLIADGVHRIWQVYR